MPPLWILFVLLPVLGGAERFNCRGRILGAYYADAKSGCKAFHVCVRVAGGGIRDFRFFCPPGTLFHQEAQTCTDWGDDDPLACPADIYDGQFDLYKIGSGFDTKKVSSSGNRDEESEFGLQRAETGDRRLPENNGASDLRAAHSSDFFSGQRDRGRDDTPAPAQVSPQSHNSQTRQSFRRATTPRTTPITTQYNNAAATRSRQPQKQAQYDPNSKRKLVRKRPIYVSTPAPTTTFAQQNINTLPPHYSEQPQNENNYSPIVVPDNHQTNPPVSIPPEFKEYKDEYVEVSRVTPKPNKFFNNPPSGPFSQSSPVPNNNFNKKDGLVELYSFKTESTPYFNKQNNNGPFNASPKHTESVSGFNKQNNNGPFNNSPKHTETTPAFNKQNNNGPFNAPPKRPETSSNYNKQNNGAFNVQNSFSISDAPRESDFVRIRNGNANSKVRIAPTTVTDFSQAPSRATASTPAYKNVNSVSYESEKNNFVPYSKQNYFNSPTTPSSTTTYETTTHYEPLARLNTVAYNTNIGFNPQNSNFADSEEDDGQYRPPQGEDDGQYRPELYERELLSGAHSLNIAASGNRLPADQKPRGKPQTPYKSDSHTAAPRPFRPAPTPSTPAPTPQVSENHPTTVSPQSRRTFDYFQTYTTTSRPSEASASPVSVKYETSAPVRPVTTPAPRTQEPRVQHRPSPPPPQPSITPTPPPRPTTRQPHFAKAANKQEDTSYDYAYYDSDPGFSEYDHIEEFGRTKTKQ